MAAWCCRFMFKALPSNLKIKMIFKKSSWKIISIIIHTGLLMSKNKIVYSTRFVTRRAILSILPGNIITIARALCDQSFNIDLRLRYVVRIWVPDDNPPTHVRTQHAPFFGLFINRQNGSWSIMICLAERRRIWWFIERERFRKYTKSHEKGGNRFQGVFVSETSSRGFRKLR